MADGTDGPPLHTRLLQKLNGNVPTNWPGRSIFKVPNHLRRISKQAYEPQVISIGPYHHGKGQLKKMEAYKMFYLKKLLGRRTEISLEDYVTALKEREEEARKFYSEPLNHISGEKFVEIMLFDGCFIIELIRKSAMGELGDENDHFLADFILRGITRDLLLVENQLPFSILLHLFSMTVTPNDEETAFMDIAKDFMEMAIKFFSKIMPGSPRSFENQDIKHLLGSSPRRPEDLKIEHLLGLLHDSCCQASSSDCPQVRLRCSPEKVIRLRCCKVKFEISIEERDEKYWRFIRSATQLSEAGINFEKTMGRLFDIKFQNGVLSIPALAIEDDTEFLLRNLVAYEQYFRDASSKCFTNYIAFMDCLINTWKDVELLCNHGVIDNWLGDHEVVAAMFNKLGDYVLIYEGDFSDYAETFKKVNEHCDRKWNHWKAKLWHNYFNTPWGGISIFAAVSLLLLTLLQSVFSVLSYLFK